MPISFNEIPVNLRVPYVYTEVDATRANTGPGVQPFKALMIGQRLTAGSVAQLTPTRLTSAAQAKNYFGEGSILHRQAIAWFKSNTTTELTAVAFDDPSGSVAAAGDIDFAGTATASGTLNLYIAGERIQVGVTVGDDGADVATATAAAINAKENMPVSAAVDGVDTTQVNITAKNKGLLGNDIDVRFNYFDGETTPAGITATITEISGGTGAPDFDGLFSILDDTWFNVWVLPYNDTASLFDVESELNDRNGPLRQIDAVAFTAKTATHSTLATFGNAQNSQFITCLSPAGSSSPTPDFEISANYAAVESLSLNIDAARPTQTLELPHVLAPRKQDRFTQQENNLLLYDGIATSYVDSSGGVRIQRDITFYQENSQGADDIAYLDVNTLFTLQYLRWSVRNRILLKFPRHKLANDGTRFGAGQAIVTPKIMKAEIVSLFEEWENIGLVENATQFVNEMIVERNVNDPSRLDIQLPPNLVNQLRVTAIQIQFIV